MKLTNYSPTVQPNTINGRGNPVSNPSDARAWGADVSGINALGNAVGIGLKMAEDDMTADVTNAMNEYNKRMDDLMYNQENGLAYLKNENARNVTQLYQEGEKKIRDEVFKMVPKYKKAQDLFIQKANASTIAGIEDTQKQAYREHQNYQMAVTNDTIETAQIAISHNYDKKGFIGQRLGDIRAAIYANGQAYGNQWCKDKYEEVAGKTVSDALAQAKADDNQPAVDDIINNYGGMINPAYIRQFVAGNNAQKKQNFMITESQQLATRFRKDPQGLRNYIDKMTIKEPTTGNYGSMILGSFRNMIGAPFDIPGGTGCVYYSFKAVRDAGFDVPDIKDTDSAEAWAKRDDINLWRGPDYKPQPGDMAIVSNSMYDNGHAGVVTENGVIQAGNHNGARDVYETPDTDPETGLGGKIYGYIAFSQLNGGGVGPAKDRPMTPAEKERLYKATLSEINLLDSQDRKVKHDSLDSVKQQMADLASQGIYDTQTYLEIARRNEGVGGLTMADMLPLVNSFANSGAGIAGVSRRRSGSGTGSSAAEKRERKAQWAEAVADGTLNQTQAENALVLMGVQKGSSEFNSLMKMWSVASLGDYNMSLMKQRWKNEGHSAEDFKYAVPYMMNYIIGQKQAGKTVSQAEAYQALLDGEQPESIWVGDDGSEERKVKKNALYNGFGIYSHDESNGLSYAENVDEPFYISDKEINDVIGSVPAEEDN
ncbi:CHAP domain-containing protein [Acidaminococcus massiliensis]